MQHYYLLLTLTVFIHEFNFPCFLPFLKTILLKSLTSFLEREAGVSLPLVNPRIERALSSWFWFCLLFLVTPAWNSKESSHSWMSRALGAFHVPSWT